jgi:hypothetical protein
MADLGPHTIEAQASRIAHDPDDLRRHLAVHAAVLAIIDAPSPMDMLSAFGVAEFNGGMPA